MSNFTNHNVITDSANDGTLEKTDAAPVSQAQSEYGITDAGNAPTTGEGQIQTTGDDTMSTLGTTLIPSLNGIFSLDTNSVEVSQTPGEQGTREAIALAISPTVEEGFARYAKWYKPSPEEAQAFRLWLRELPVRVHTHWPAPELHHSWTQFQKNTRILHNMENRVDELGVAYNRIMGELEAQGFTLDDLVTFDRVSRGGSMFPSHGDAGLPASHRRDAQQGSQEEADRENRRAARQAREGGAR